MNAATKRVMDLSVAGMRQVVGDRLYHTLGDPLEVVEERERPAILLPLWAFDQFVVTEEGEEVPELTDARLPEMGHKRVGQIREYKRLMDALDLRPFIFNLLKPFIFITIVTVCLYLKAKRLKWRPGPTFTFCFWGVSRFCDVMTWQATGIPLFTPIDLNLYCGKPPLNLVLYTLPQGCNQQQKHLQSLKTYYFRCCFWSSLKRPAKEVVANVAGQSLELLKRRQAHLRKQQKQPQRSVFGLNVFQRPGKRL